MTNNFNADMISFLHLVTRLTPFVYFTINYIYIHIFTRLYNKTCKIWARNKIKSIFINWHKYLHLMHLEYLATTHRTCRYPTTCIFKNFLNHFSKASLLLFYMRQRHLHHSMYWKKTFEPKKKIIIMPHWA